MSKTSIYKPVTRLASDYTGGVAARLAKNSESLGGGCISWTGGKFKGGYGKIKVMDAEEGRRRQTGTHRAAWMVACGEIPDGLEVDHLCFNTSCLNVDHMELVSPQENLDRRRRAGRLRIGPSTHECKKHGQLEGSINTDKRGYRYWRCLICKRANYHANK